MEQGILLGHFLCDSVQGVERLLVYSRHFPSEVLLSGCTAPRITDIKTKQTRTMVKDADLF